MTMTHDNDKHEKLFYTFFHAGKIISGDEETAPSFPPLSQVGGKALSLIQATSLGFPVPRGFVLTVKYFEPWMKALMQQPAWTSFADQVERNDITKEVCDAVKEACQRLFCDPSKTDRTMTVALQEAIDEVFDTITKENSSQDALLVAVRSSSPEEDLAGSSFAGGYETTLGVPLLDDQKRQQALVESFVSMFDYRVVQYKLKMQQSASKNDVTYAVLYPRIAVVVQEQLRSSTSGVAFSMNPSNNCYDEITITANFGLGESVVCGIVTPDVYVVLNNNPEDEEINSDRFRIVDRKIGSKKESIWLASTNNGQGCKRCGTLQRSNSASTEPSLTDAQVLQVAELVAQVEQSYKKLQQSSLCPVDLEWAYQDEELYLLQARPVTTHIPLFPEMLTPRGSGKRNLYLDVIVMTQGFSEPFSVLGLDIWKTFLGLVKPQFTSDGPEGMSWNLHGREYMHMSNFLMTLGGRKMIEKAFMQYDPALRRAIGSINLDDYTPTKTPSSASGFIWKQLRQIRIALPAMFWGFWYKDKAMDEYEEFVDKLVERFNASNDAGCTSDFETLVTSTLSEYCAVAMSAMARIVASYWSRYRLNGLFQGQEGADDLLISLCMDLKGNPTSEMGHAMVRLASMPEIQTTASGEEFCRKLEEDGAFSDEFMEQYHDFLNRYGCRGMKEIDIASTRTSEDPAGLFRRLKEIDIEHNAIINVSQRRQHAHDKLQDMAKAMGKEETFKYHDNIIQHLLGYRENPKYIYVFMNAMYRRHVLKIGAMFIEQDRLDKVDDVFNLTMKEISNAQTDSSLDLRSLIAAHLKPYEAVRHVKNWPVLIDSRGKILRENRPNDPNDPDILLGDPVAPGKVKGKAKILNSPYEKPLYSGEVLVARFTEPSWTPIFINASAVIMEIGGPLQHGAIIAREYGIPCVSGLENATSLIQDGDMLEVDGSSGTIRFLHY